jgi:hypothetical protein
MSIWWQLAIGVAGVWLVLHFILKLAGSREPSASMDDPLVGDSSAGVPSPKRRGPQNRSGAVALVEPDEDDDDRRFPPRSL